MVFVPQERVPIVPVDLAPPSVSPAAAAAAVDAAAAERKAQRQRWVLAAPTPLLQQTSCTEECRKQWEVQADDRMRLQLLSFAHEL
jgi:hypothetical protein